MKIQLGDKIYNRSVYKYPYAKYCALKTASYVCVIGFRIRCGHHIFNPENYLMYKYLIYENTIS